MDTKLVSETVQERDVAGKRLQTLSSTACSSEFMGSSRFFLCSPAKLVGASRWLAQGSECNAGDPSGRPYEDAAAARPYIASNVIYDRESAS